MNITGGNTLNIGRRFNWQLVTLLAGGLAVAVSIAAASGAFERDSSPASTAVTRPQPATIPGPVVPTSGQDGDLVYVLTASEAEANVTRSALSTYTANLPELADQVARTHVVVLETAEQEAQFNEQLAIASAELMMVDAWLDVIDLRTPAAPPAPFNGEALGEQPSPIVYMVGSQAEKIALEQQFHEAGGLGDTTVRSVFVLDGPDANAVYNTIVGEQLESGTFEIVDLRN
jgi:hypothetical protein